MDRLSGLSTALDGAFDVIAAEMARAAQERSKAIATAAAERFGLREQGDGSPSQRYVWERREGEVLLRFQWRWFDQSHPFSIQPDMNVLYLELRQADALLRSTEARYED